MMKDHRTSRLRMLGGAAAITLLAGVSASFGSAGLAHPHPDSDAKQRRTERIIIMDQKGDHPQGDAERRTRERVLTIRRGENGEVELPEACGESERLVDSSEGEDNNRTRIVMCTRGEADAGTRLERLQRARERLSTMEALDDEHRARVLATIDREIARLRGQ